MGKKVRKKPEMSKNLVSFFELEGADVMNTIDQLAQKCIRWRACLGGLVTIKAQIIKYNRTEVKLTNQYLKQVIDASFFWAWRGAELVRSFKDVSKAPCTRWLEI